MASATAQTLLLLMTCCLNNLAIISVAGDGPPPPPPPSPAAGAPCDVQKVEGPVTRYFNCATGAKCTKSAYGLFEEWLGIVAPGTCQKCDESGEKCTNAPGVVTECKSGECKKVECGFTEVKAGETFYYNCTEKDACKDEKCTAGSPLVTVCNKSDLEVLGGKCLLKGQDVGNTGPCKDVVCTDAAK